MVRTLCTLLARYEGFVFKLIRRAGLDALIFLQEVILYALLA